MISAAKSSSVAALEPLFLKLKAEPGILTEMGTKYLPFCEAEVVDLDGHGEIGNGVVAVERLLELSFLVGAVSCGRR